MKRSRFLLQRAHRIVFDGDSITARKTPPSLDTWPFLRLMGWERTWADDFSEILFCLRPDLKLAFNNAAVGGSIITDALERFDRSVAPHKPDWVFMTIGSNDAARKIPVGDFARGVTDYARRLKKLSGGRVVLLGGKSGGDRIPYYRALRRIAEREGGLYVDIGAPLRTKEKQLLAMSEYHTVFSDGGHLNNVGCLIVAGAVLAALKFEW